MNNNNDPAIVDLSLRRRKSAKPPEKAPQNNVTEDGGNSDDAPAPAYVPKSDHIHLSVDGTVPEEILVYTDKRDRQIEEEKAERETGQFADSQIVNMPAYIYTQELKKSG